MRGLRGIREGGGFSSSHHTDFGRFFAYYNSGEGEKQGVFINNNNKHSSCSLISDTYRSLPGTKTRKYKA